MSVVAEQEETIPGRRSNNFLDIMAGITIALIGKFEHAIYKHMYIYFLVTHNTVYIAVSNIRLQPLGTVCWSRQGHSHMTACKPPTP